MQTILAIVTVTVVGLMVGVELSVAAFMNPIFDRLPVDSGMAARSDGGRVLGRLMPFWYIGSVVLAAVWAAASWTAPGTTAVLVAIGLLVVSVVMSVTLLVPINKRAIRWAEQGAPADWRDQVHRWDRLHQVRVAVIVAAFVLLVVAAAS
jgi:uncharacterized membrane protein